jgi:RNA polymerase sigma-70 factor (ECF subfamily)
MSDRIERLCGQARSGDDAAASELVTAFYEKVFAYFRRLSGNDDEAADLTQKTFFKAWVSLASYEGRSSFSTWLHGIAHHVYVDWRRKPDRSDRPPDAWWELCPASTPSPFDDTAERDVARQLYRAVDQLEDGSREAVHLHYYQGLSLAETADALGVAVSTVKYRLRGALDLIKRRIAEPKVSNL